MSKQMLSEHVPVKMFNALSHQDGDTIDHASEGESLADIETIAALLGTTTQTTGTVSASTKTVYDDVETASTGIKARVGTYSNANAIGTDLKSVYDDVETASTGIKARMPEYIATMGIATAASKVLTVAATPAEGETVTIGTTAYKARLDALGSGVAATAVLTSDETEVSDGDTVTIGTTVYRFKDTMAAAYDVKRDGTTADTTLANLVKAVNLTGTAGVEYYAGTLIHPTASAGAVTSHAITFTAKTVGFAGNAIAKTLSAAHLDWDGTGSYLTGGIDAKANNDVFVNSNAEQFIINLEKAIEATGTNSTDYYFTTPAARTDAAVSAKNASTMTLTALTKGVAGNSIVIAETLGNASSVWAAGATALSGGIDGTVGATGKVYFTASAVYFGTDGTKQTISDSSGWKTASLT